MYVYKYIYSCKVIDRDFPLTKYESFESRQDETSEGRIFLKNICIFHRCQLETGRMSGPPPHKLQYPAPPSEDEDPSEMVIRKNALARAARKANEDKENLEKINRRINLVL